MAISKWPSAAQDYNEKNLDLNKRYVKNPPATFFFEAEGDDMRDAGIFNKDLVIADFSAKPVPGKLVVVIIEGKYTVRRLKLRGNRLYVKSEIHSNPEMDVTDDLETVICGVVIHVIHSY